MAFPFRKLLAPVDLDELAVVGLMVARDFARKEGAMLYLLHVVPQDEFGLLQAKYRPWETGGGDGMHAARVAECALTRMAGERLGEGIELEVMIRSGDPAPVVLEVQREIAADLIVMGARGRSGVAHTRLGSVAEAVAREAPCPVLTVRAS